MSRQYLYVIFKTKVVFTISLIFLIQLQATTAGITNNKDLNNPIANHDSELQVSILESDVYSHYVEVFAYEILLASSFGTMDLSPYTIGFASSFILAQSKVDEIQFVSATETTLSDLQEFKFLLSPTRLAILKVLQDHIEITSSDLRNIIDVSWGVLRQNLQALEKNDYVQLNYKFIEDKAVYVVSINMFGMQEYSRLRTTLNHLFD